MFILTGIKSISLKKWFVGYGYKIDCLLRLKDLPVYMLIFSSQVLDILSGEQGINVPRDIKIGVGTLSCQQLSHDKIACAFKCTLTYLLSCMDSNKLKSQKGSHSYGRSRSIMYEGRFLLNTTVRLSIVPTFLLILLITLPLVLVMDICIITNREAYWFNGKYQ